VLTPPGLRLRGHSAFLLLRLFGYAVVAVLAAAVAAAAAAVRRRLLRLRLLLRVARRLFGRFVCIGLFGPRRQVQRLRGDRLEVLGV
jgi:hypothetical protein